MKKILAVLLSILLVGTIFVGCSKKDDDTSKPTNSTTNSDTNSTDSDDQNLNDVSSDTNSTEEPKVQILDTFIFGGKDKAGKTFLFDQGERNFYYMCTPETNKKGTYDFELFRELALTPAEEWKPSPDDQAMYGNGYWFTLKDDGSVFPCDGFSGVIQFKAPKDGKYNIKINYYGLMKWDAPDNPTDIVPDGVYLTAFIKNEKVIEYDATSKKMDVATFTRDEVVLKKGETITIVADPKKNSGWDLSNWNIIVEQLG